MTASDRQWESAGRARLWKYCAETLDYSNRTFGQAQWTNGQSVQTEARKARMACLQTAKSTWVLDMTTSPVEQSIEYQDELWRDLMLAAERQALADRGQVAA